MADISAGDSAGTHTAFAIGGVFGNSLSIFGRNFALFVLICAVLTLPFLIASLTASDPVVIAPRTGVIQSGLLRHSRIWLFLLPILQSLAQAPVIAGVFAHMQGRRVRASEALLTFVRRIGPIAMVSVLQTMAFTIGLAVLVVPGIIAWTMLYVAVPACIGERLGVIASLNRSAALTKGDRWKLLGLGLVIVLAIAIPGIIVQQLGFKLGGPAGLSIAEYLLQAVSMPFQATVATVVYQALRSAKEGTAIETLSEVFA